MAANGNSRPQHFPKRQVHRFGQLFHVAHRDVALTPFHLSDVGPVHACHVRQQFLRQLQILTGKPQSESKTHFGRLWLDGLVDFSFHKLKGAV